MSVVEAVDFTDDELADLNREFEHLPASKIIQWAVDSFAPHLSLSASMQDAVLIDIATKVDPGIEVVFIDTGYHFPETLDTVEAVRRRYGLNLRIMTVRPFAEPLWELDPENCCSSVKVGQLDRALAGKVDGFITLAHIGPGQLGQPAVGTPWYNDPSSAVGAPTFNLPLLAVEGLPLGVQLMGFEGGDETLTAHARWLLEAFGSPTVGPG